MKFWIAGILICISAFGFYKYRQEESQKKEPWTNAQLLEPVSLARRIEDIKGKQPVILCVGPGALIKGSIDLGSAHEAVNLEKLRKELSLLNPNTDLVIYCGCCPFGKCPNIRPAFTMVNEMKFTHAQLLNIEHNIKTDWINKGYPVNP